MRRTEIAQTGVWFLFQPLQHRRGHAGLADPWLAGQQDDLTFAGLRTRPAAHQAFKFLLAAHQGSGAGSQRLEPAQHAAFGDHAPGVLRFGETGQRLWAEVGEVEQAANLAARAVGNDNCVGFGKPLNPGSEVRGFPDNAAFLRRTGADQIADHGEAGGNADADPQCHPAR